MQEDYSFLPEGRNGASRGVDIASKILSVGIAFNSGGLKGSFLSTEIAWAVLIGSDDLPGSV